MGSDSDEFYVYIRSDDSNYVFPNNTPFNFTVQVTHPITFSSTWDWQVCLCDIHCPKPDNANPTTLTLKTDFVETTRIDENSFQILRRFFCRDFSGHVFGDYRYKAVLHTSVRQFTFSITADNINWETLTGSGVTYLTLKFRRLRKKWM
jgi:hypothetical protein